MLISERIFKIMAEKNIRQSEFSKITGIAKSTISDWKHKKTNPSADKIMIICAALNVTPEDLLIDTMTPHQKVLKVTDDIAKGKISMNEGRELLGLEKVEMPHFIIDLKPLQQEEEK